MKRARTLLSLLGLSSLAALTFAYLFATGRCDMRANLTPLFAYTTQLLNSIDAEYWIDYGTLLGGVREGALLAHEFDLDLGAREEECPRIIAALKPRAHADGMHAYERGQWITQKYNPVLGHDGYLHKPCLRIYDASHSVYIDVDFYQTYTPAQVRAAQRFAAARDAAVQRASSGSTVSVQSIAPITEPDELGHPFPKRAGGLDLPAGYDPATATSSVMCNEEGIDGGDAGGCRLREWMLPLRPFAFSDDRLPQMRAPNDVVRNLEAMYGADWRTPRPKGYKLLVCGWLPHSSGVFLALLLLTLIGPALCFFLCERYGREALACLSHSAAVLTGSAGAHSAAPAAHCKGSVLDHVLGNACPGEMDLELALLNRQREESDAHNK